MTSQLRAQATAPKRPPKMASNQSLNHLLNFTLPPRQIQPQIVPRRSKKAVHSAVWNKESEYRLLYWSCYFLQCHRVRECAVPVCYESKRRLYSPLRRSRHVRFTICTWAAHTSLLNSAFSNGMIYCRSLFHGPRL